MGLKIVSRQCKSGRIIKVRVTPRSSRTRVEEAEDGSYSVYLKAVPEKGRANSELLVVLADYLRVPRSEIVIIRGSRSRDKILKVREKG